jgi:hypothetical protein
MNFLENQMAQNIANRIAIEKARGKILHPGNMAWGLAG